MAVEEYVHHGFYPFEVTPAHLAYTLLGAFTVIFGMFSSFFKEKLYLGEAPIATIFGIILGPHVAGLIDPYSWGGGDRGVTDEITLEVTRVVIAISVFAVGVELPKKYMLRHWRTMFILLIPCMLWGWFISALFMYALFPGLKFLSCLVIAAAVTPTDPILAQSVIGGSYAEKHVPAHIRHMLSAESGSNDGAAFPFLYIALYLLLDSSPGHAVGEWFYATIAYEIILGTILGVLIGWVARKVMVFSERRKYIDRQSFVAQYVSLALLATGGTVLLGSDDLLSAFACGCAFAWNGYFNRQTEDAVFSNVVDLLFNCAAFIYIGALLPFPDFNNVAIGLDWWRLVVLAICILLVRRLPSVLLLYRFIPDIKTFREAVFTGWFGPMGVGAVFISTLARHSLPYGDPDADTAQVDRVREIITPITLFLVLSSVLSHGLSIPFFSLGRRVHSITYTRSRQLSQRDNQPAWTTQVRHVQPGQSIIVNRDEDAEDGDAGILRTTTSTTPEDSLAREKLGHSSSGSGSSDDRTRHDIEMSEKRPSSSGSGSGSASGSGSGRGDAEKDQEGPGGAVGERAARDNGGRSRTPSVMEFREGNDLIIERRRSGSQEVEVELIKNHFGEQESLSHKFTHPNRLGEEEVGHLRNLLPRIERFASDLSIPFVSRIASRESRASRTDQSLDEADEGCEGNEDGRSRGKERARAGEDDEGADDARASANVPRIEEPSSEPRGAFAGIRQRLFGRRSPSPSTEDRLEAGEGSSRSQPRIRIQDDRPSPSDSDPDLLSPSSARGNGGPQPYRSAGSGGSSTPSRNQLELTRTQSVSRTIRFAQEATNDSETAPGNINNGSNYGNNQPGFRRNPGLAMFRTSSIKSGDHEDD